ncbi:MAG: hypothetical protein JJE46_00440, partial [Acidimicrobiia bacterium]|nr:hypothetical protein [Acidimicrobiia bacterium]
MRLPIRIILWLVAFVLSAFIVRSFAKWTGIAGSQQLLDSMIDKGFGTYFRLFILVPIWGLFATILATAFIDGPAWWARRSVQPAPPRNRTVPAATGAAAAASGQKAVSKPGARKVPTRPPSRAAAPAPAPAPVPAPRAE